MSENKILVQASKPKRVLHFGMLGGIGGVETFIMNIYRNIDREKLQFDFITLHNQDIAFSDEILSMGGKIYSCLYSKHESVFRHSSAWKVFFDVHKSGYCAVHQHANFPRYSAPLRYAKKYGIKKRIFHAHNSMNMYPSDSFVLNLQKEISERITINNLKKYATDLFACSDLAANYMYRGRYDYKFIPNAIETDKFIYNESMRDNKRRELNLGDKFVIGTVGRLQYQKNPEFIIEIFNAVHRTNPNSELIMVGIGVLEDKIRKMIADYKLTDCVQLLGRRYDVPELMQAFDCFLLPSRFEGLGIVYIEAQAAGLRCFASEGVVPMEAKVTELMNYISLDKPAEFWADKILESHDTERINMKSEIIKAGYDIKEMAKTMQEFYLK